MYFSNVNFLDLLDSDPAFACLVNVDNLDQAEHIFEWAGPYLLADETTRKLEALPIEDDSWIERSCRDALVDLVSGIEQHGLAAVVEDGRRMAQKLPNYVFNLVKDYRFLQREWLIKLYEEIPQLREPRIELIFDQAVRDTVHEVEDARSRNMYAEFISVVWMFNRLLHEFGSNEGFQIVANLFQIGKEKSERQRELFEDAPALKNAAFAKEIRQSMQDFPQLDEPFRKYLQAFQQHFDATAASAYTKLGKNRYAERFNNLVMEPAERWPEIVGDLNAAALSELAEIGEALKGQAASLRDTDRVSTAVSYLRRAVIEGTEEAAKPDCVLKELLADTARPAAGAELYSGARARIATLERLADRFSAPETVHLRALVERSVILTVGLQDGIAPGELERSIERCRSVLNQIDQAAFPSLCLQLWDGISQAHYCIFERFGLPEHMEESLRLQAGPLWKGSFFEGRISRMRHSHSVGQMLEERPGPANTIGSELAWIFYDRALTDTLWLGDNSLTGLVLTNIARYYKSRRVGSILNNHLEAITAGKEAVAKIDPGLPTAVAKTLHTLARSYFDIPQGNAGIRAQKAIATLTEALNVLPRERMPELWALIHLDFAKYSFSLDSEWAENLNAASSHLAMALTVFQAGRYPQHYGYARALEIQFQAEAAGLSPAAVGHAVRSVEALAEELRGRITDSALTVLLVQSADTFRRTKPRTLPEKHLLSLLEFYERWNPFMKQAGNAQNWAQFQLAYAACCLQCVHYFGDHYARRAIQAAAEAGTVETLVPQTRHLAAGIRFLAAQLLGDDKRVGDAALEGVQAAEKLFKLTPFEDERLEAIWMADQFTAEAGVALVRSGRLAESMEFFERSRGRLVRAAVQSLEIEVSEEEREEIAKQENRLAPLLAEYRGLTAKQGDPRMMLAEEGTPPPVPAGLIDEVERGVENLQELRERLGFGTTLEPLRGDEILHLVPEGGFLVTLFIDHTSAFAVVLSRMDARAVEWIVVRLGNLSLPTVSAWEAAWGSAGARFSVLRSMWDLMMGPIDAELTRLSHNVGNGRVGEVLIWHPGALHQLPLQAAESDKGDYFADRWAVRYAPAGAVLRHGMSHPPVAPGDRRVLCVADTRGDLAFAPIEAEKVACAFGRSSLMVGDAGTVEAFRANVVVATHLHLAVHAKHDFSRPFASQIQFSGEESLTVDELRKLGHLAQTRFVFLSACSSGQVGMQHPNEMLGIGTGFHLCGVPSVVATLWPVNDLACVFIADRFYRGHLGTGTSVAVSLRDALIGVREATWRELLGLGEDWENTTQASVNLLDYLGPVRDDRTTEWIRHNNYQLELTDLDLRPFEDVRLWGSFFCSGI